MSKCLLKIDDVINVDDIIVSETNYLFHTLYGAIGDYLDSKDIEFTDTPFASLLSDYQELDIGYFVEHSNQKYISPFFERLLKIKEENNYSLDWVFEKLSKQIANKYSVQWKKVYDALITEYKPLENYSMVENREHDNTVKQNTDLTTSVENQNGLHGFNSSKSNPTTDNVGSTTVSGDKDKNYQSDSGEESTTRTGNIGVTTSQQMLESEIKLRQYNFINQIFDDIDKILCLSIY